MPTYVDDLNQVTAASVAGAQHYTQTVSGGMQRLMSDLGRMMPEAPPANMHPYVQVRHGMYGHEMSLTGDVKAMLGFGTPNTTTTYEYQALAREDMSRRIANASVFGAMNTAGAAATWVGGSAMFSAVPKVFKAGRAIATGMGMGAMGAGAVGVAAATGVGALGLAAFEAADRTIGKIVDDVKDRQDVMNFLEASSFRYMQGQGPDIDEKFGAGFNRKARGQIAEAIKQVDLGDSRFNMQDLKGVLERGTEMGMFEGTRDAEDFASKFKDLTKNLKTVTRVLHQSLAEGMQTIKDLKEQGYRGPAAINQAVMQADVLGTASGRTAAEMLSIGRQGAEMVRGTGINLSTGSGMMQQTYGMLQGAIQAGTLDKESVAQAGGIGALTQKVMGQSIGMMNSEYGRGILFSLMNKGGGLDVNRLESLASGETSLGDVLGQGRGNLDTGANYIKAVISRGQTIKDISKKYGNMGMVYASMGAEITAAKEIVARHSTDDNPLSVREAIKFAAMQRGESEESIDARLAIFDNVENQRSKQGAALRTTAAKMAGEELRERVDIAGRLGDKVDRLFQPISRDVGRAVDSIQKSVSDVYTDVSESFQDWVMGTERVKGRNITGKDIYNVIMSGGAGPQESRRDRELKERLDDNIWTQAEKKAFIAHKEDAGKLTAAKRELNIVNEQIDRGGILSKAALGGKLTPQEQDLLKRQGELQESVEDYTTYSSIDKEVGDKFLDVGIGRAAGDLKSLTKYVFNKEWDDLTRKEKMYLQNKASEIGGMTRVEEQIKQKVSDAYKERKEIGVNALLASQEKIKKLETDTESSREEIIEDILIKPMDRLTGGLPASIERLQEDKEGARALDSFITSTGRLKELQKKADSAEGLSEQEQKELADVTKKHKSSIKQMTKIGEMSLPDVMKLKERLLTSDKPELLAKHAEVSSNLFKARGGDARQRLVTALEDKFAGVTLRAAGKLSDEDDREDLRDILEKVRTGKGLSTGETEDLSEIAKKSGESALSTIVRRARTIKDIDKVSGDDPDKLKANLDRFLSQENMYSGMSKEEQKKVLNKYAQMTTDEREKTLLQEMSLVGERDVAGTGAVKGGRQSKTIEQELSVMQGLADVQSRISDNLRQLEKLSAHLLPKTKVK